jgi:serine/threonine-protein kinase RsbW/stage II sporulation protein AB (anti-sigma F factor)
MSATPPRRAACSPAQRTLGALGDGRHDAANEGAQSGWVGLQPRRSRAARAVVVPEPQRWIVSSQAECIGPVRRAVADYAVLAGLAKDRVDDVRLAVSEAMTNAVLHAYRDSGGRGEVRVSVNVDANRRLRIVVEDDGPGVVPRSDSPGLGRGLATIDAVATRLEIDPEYQGARLSMWFSPTG